MLPIAADYRVKADRVNEHEAPLLVEVFLHGARIKGLCREVGLRRRLIEILNKPGEVFELESAVVKHAVGAPLHAQSLSVQKKSIVAAIPWETREQNRQRTLDTSMIGRSQTTPLALVAFAPPFVFSGIAHMPVTYVDPRRTLHPDASVFQRFFPITKGRMTLADGSQIEAPVVIVSRDSVSAMSRAAEPSTVRLGA
jgi:hypothetical protein